MYSSQDQSYLGLWNNETDRYPNRLTLPFTLMVIGVPHQINAPRRCGWSCLNVPLTIISHSDCILMLGRGKKTKALMVCWHSAQNVDKDLFRPLLWEVNQYNGCCQVLCVSPGAFEQSHSSQSFAGVFLYIPLWPNVSRIFATWLIHIDRSLTLTTKTLLWSMHFGAFILSFILHLYVCMSLWIKAPPKWIQC